MPILSHGDKWKWAGVLLGHPLHLALATLCLWGWWMASFSGFLEVCCAHRLSYPSSVRPAEMTDLLGAETG